MAKINPNELYNIGAVWKSFAFFTMAKLRSREIIWPAIRTITGRINSRSHCFGAFNLH